MTKGATLNSRYQSKITDVQFRNIINWRLDMKLNVVAETRITKRGNIEARAPELHLTAHGINELKALESLKQGILAWCNGLNTIGKLDQTLNRKHINWSQEGSGIHLEFTTRLSEKE